MNTIGSFLYTAYPIALLLTVFLPGCSKEKSKSTADNIRSNISRPSTAIDRDSLFYGLIADDSTTVFDLTVKNYMVEYEKSGFDYFVFSINTVDQGDDYFWVYAVNDTMGQVAANNRKIGRGDRVVWHYRLITR
jgi:hypothetical protein